MELPKLFCDHERFGGGGYPDGLSGADIPLGARILTVVDSFCAILDKRAYKEARSVAEATDELRKCSGTQFDPELVHLFVRMLGRGAFDRLVEAESPAPDQGGSAAA